MAARLTWIFDLDNTLHDYRSRIMPHVSRSMTEFLQRDLGLSEEEASSLRQSYLRRYGATLAGMMRLHCIERARFHPKPSPRGFRLLLRAERLVPGRCVLVDDTLENLRAAKRLRMKTVWISREARVPASVDIRVASVLALPRLADDLA